MKKTINIFLIIFSLVLFQNCEEEQFEPSLDYVSFGTDISTGVDVGGTQNVSVAVYTAENVSSATTYALIVDESTNADPGSYFVPPTVTIPAGSNTGTIEVALSDVNLGIGINNLVIGFGDAGMTTSTGQPVTIDYIQNCTEVTATLDITFDRWGSEVAWEILDSEGGLVISSFDDYGNTAGGSITSDSIDITLCAGRSYSIELIDTYGDGWNGEGVLTTPAYTLTIGGTVKATGDGDLGGTNGGSGEISITIPFDTL